MSKTMCDQCRRPLVEIDNCGERLQDRAACSLGITDIWVEAGKPLLANALRVIWGETAWEAHGKIELAPLRFGHDAQAVFEQLDAVRSIIFPFGHGFGERGRR